MIPFLKTPTINYREVFAKGKDFAVTTSKEFYQNAIIARGKSKDLVKTNYELGLYHMSQRNISDAILRFFLTTLLRPDHLLAHYQLGRCYMIKGLYAKASREFHKVLALKEDHPESLYYLAVLGEITPPNHLPGAIIEEHFDMIAPQYNDNILAELHYTGHTQIAEKIATQLPAELTAPSVLDLGCGTGLCGSEIKKRLPAATVTGIDIAANMLSQATRLYVGGSLIYQTTEKKSIAAILEEKAGTYNIIISGMALHYIGELRPIFDGIRPMLADDGVFVFTVQHSEGRGMALTEDMKNFAYSQAYIKETAEAAGLMVIDISEQPLYEGLPGLLCVLKTHP